MEEKEGEIIMKVIFVEDFHESSIYNEIDLNTGPILQMDLELITIFLPVPVINI